MICYIAAMTYKKLDSFSLIKHLYRCTAMHQDAFILYVYFSYDYKQTVKQKHGMFSWKRHKQNCTRNENQNVRVRTSKISIMCCNKHDSNSYGYVVFFRIKTFFLENDNLKTVDSWVEMSYVQFVPLSGRVNALLNGMQ